MGEVDKKYEQYHYASAQASSDVNDNNNDKEDFLDLISEGKSISRPRRDVDIDLLKYPGRFVQNIELVSSQEKNLGTEELGDIGIERVTKSVSRSVGKHTPVKMSTKKEKNLVDLFGGLPKPLQKAVAVIVTCLLLVLGAEFADQISNISDWVTVNKYVQEYENIYDDNAPFVAGVDKYGDQNREYDAVEMGREVAASEEPDVALYAVYSGGKFKQKYKRYDITHMAFASAKAANPDVFGDCKDFTDYAASLGCVDKEGNIDYDLYETQMETIILAKQSLAGNSYGSGNVK